MIRTQALNRERTAAAARECTHGALVGLNVEPHLGQNVDLQNVATSETQKSIVVFVIMAKDGKFVVGIEFAAPNPSFWHMSFPPEDWSISHPDAKANLV